MAAVAGSATKVLAQEAHQLMSRRAVVPSNVRRCVSAIESLLHDLDLGGPCTGMSGRGAIVVRVDRPRRDPIVLKAPLDPRHALLEIAASTGWAAAKLAPPLLHVAERGDAYAVQWVDGPTLGRVGHWRRASSRAGLAEWFDKVVSSDLQTEPSLSLPELVREWISWIPTRGTDAVARLGLAQTAILSGSAALPQIEMHGDPSRDNLICRPSRDRTAVVALDVLPARGPVELFVARCALQVYPEDPDGFIDVAAGHAELDRGIISELLGPLAVLTRDWAPEPRVKELVEQFWQRELRGRD